MLITLLKPYLERAVKDPFADATTNEHKQELCQWLSELVDITPEKLQLLSPISLACAICFLEKQYGQKLLAEYLDSVTPNYPEKLTGDWFDGRGLIALLSYYFPPNLEGLWQAALLREEDIEEANVSFSPAAAVWLSQLPLKRQNSILKNKTGGK